VVNVHAGKQKNKPKGSSIMAKLSKENESLHQSAATYALETLNGVAWQLARLEVPFSDVVEKLGDVERDRYQDSDLLPPLDTLKGRALRDELYRGSVAFAENNLMAATYELDSLNWTLPQILAAVRDLLRGLHPESTQPPKP
jgi:hypothetical protein